MVEGRLTGQVGPEQNREEDKEVYIQGPSLAQSLLSNVFMWL